MVGMVCTECGDEIVYSSGMCKKCNDKKYYENNKEIILRRVKKYRKEHKEQIAVKRKEHYEENKIEINEKQKQYRDENKDAVALKRKIYTAANKESISITSKKYKEANKEHAKQNLYKNSDRKPMNENKSCSLFLGVHVAERILSMVFKDVERMPHGHIGYDFICNKGMKIDVKSACVSKDRINWKFTTNKNRIADYFLCIAFDNRTDLNPLHLWLIPGDKNNGKKTIVISESTISKWNEYALDINTVLNCCDKIK